MIRTLRTLLCGEPDVMLDHVPVSTDAKRAERQRAKRLKIAAERHGKPFHSHTKKERETPPSRTLQEFQQASKPAPANVRDINKPRARKA